MIENAAIAQLDIVADDGIGPDSYSGAKSSRGRNYRPRIDFSQLIYSTHSIFRSVIFVRPQARAWVGEPAEAVPIHSGPRSEERRVGKECGSRGARES